MAVTVDSTASKASKEASPTESDSPTTTAIDLGLERLEEEQEDVENLKRRANTEEDSLVDQRPTKKRRRVVFECADIVEFEPTVYTTSVTSGGVPVGLSLNERSRSRRRLDSYEMERESEGRVGRQNYMEEGYLDPQEREIILNNAGCEEPAIASVEAEVNTIIQHRRESNEIDYEFMYNVGELEDEDDVEEENAPTTMVFEQDDGSAEEEGESEEEQENSMEEEVADVDEVPSEDCSVDPEQEQERYQEAEAKTKLRRATYVKVQDLTPGSQGHNLVLQVVSIAATVEKKRYDGSISRIAESVLADETGYVTFTARNDQIDMLKEGLVVVVRNSNADIFNGFMRLNVTQWGKLSLHPDGVESTPPAPPSVNSDNNISAIEYELVTVDDPDE
ncbi:hypothetical protein BBJ29_002759 [Phytophthora kernoviae]|uniref:Single-stranded DNA binding protein Ssb-like OB fold domain-containing protein n=1 Tax=Phytophthora kernoviae TaxID=325452 RepID=A0A3F2RK22_9STRA|nr:hypothetical protein BBJ29_002759 [Phytophthora kernoviae]RLN58939.1 hypothetical protein BBP00_00006766 [Phytophthora kernoviae]